MSLSEHNSNLHFVSEGEGKTHFEKTSDSQMLNALELRRQTLFSSPQSAWLSANIRYKIISWLSETLDQVKRTSKHVVTLWTQLDRHLSVVPGTRAPHLELFGDVSVFTSGTWGVLLNFRHRAHEESEEGKDAAPLPLAGMLLWEMINMHIPSCSRQQEEIAAGERKKKFLLGSLHNQGSVIRDPVAKGLPENAVYLNELQGATSADNPLYWRNID